MQPQRAAPLTLLPPPPPHPRRPAAAAAAAPFAAERDARRQRQEQARAFNRTDAVVAPDVPPPPQHASFPAGWHSAPHLSDRVGHCKCARPAPTARLDHGPPLTAARASQAPSSTASTGSQLVPVLQQAEQLLKALEDNPQYETGYSQLAIDALNLPGREPRPKNNLRQVKMLRAAVEWFLDPDNEVATSRQWRSLEGAHLNELRSALDQPLPDGLDDAPRAELQALLGKVHRLRLASGGAEEEEPTEKIDVLT